MTGATAAGWVGAAMACAVVVFALGGCASSPAPAEPTPGNPTAGVTLELYARDAEQRQSYYELHRDGTLAWGGGSDALNRSTSWTGELQPQEITEILALLEQAQWFQTRPKSTREPKGQFYELRLTHGGDLRTRRVSGRWETIEPIERLLYTASLRRLEPEMQALPRAGLVEREPQAPPAEGTGEPNDQPAPPRR